MKNDPVDNHVSDRLGDHLEGDLSLAEFARVDAHLERCGECAAELRELRATVALLRALPDPEPPAELAGEVMRRIESGEGRTSRLVPIFRRVAEPRFAAALAAGVAGLVIFSSSEFGAGTFLGDPPDRIAKRSDSGSAADVRAMGASRPLPLHRTTAVRPTRASRQLARSRAVFGGVNPLERSALAGSPQGFGFYGTALPEVPLRDLDGEIEALMADPAAFLDRIRRTAENSRRPMVAPLVEHSARRGDAAAIARFAGIAAHPTAARAAAR